MNNKYNEVLFIILSSLVLFSASLIGWINYSGQMFGLYSLVDGQLAAWYSKALVIWSNPINLNVINPFQGLGSLFLPNSSWWNPGSLALALPFKQTTNYIISYSIYWIMAYISLFFLARSLGFNKIVAILTAQIYIFVLFPPTSEFFFGVPFISLAPFNAYLMTLANLLLIVFVHLGKGKTSHQLFFIALMLPLTLIFILSGSMTILTYIPPYFLMALCACFKSTKKELLWKGLAILTLIIILFNLKFFDYYQDLTELVSRGAGDTLFGINFPPPNLKNVNFYLNPQLNLLCTEHPISFFHIVALIGGCVALFYQNKRYRPLAFGFIILALIPDFILFVLVSGMLYGNLISQMNPVFYLWGSYAFHSLFAGVFILYVAQKIKVIFSKWIGIIAKHFSSNNGNFLQPLKNKVVIHGTIFFFLLIPISILIIPRYYYNQRLDNKLSIVTPIVRHLENNISLNPNIDFRGVVAAYFSGDDSPLTLHRQNGKPLNNSFLDYVEARNYLALHYKNMHMFSDLWQLKIPTLEQYGQTITKPMFIFFHKVFGNQEDSLAPSFINLYKLNIQLLKALGVKFIISDRLLHNQDLKLIIEQKCPKHEDGICINHRIKALEIYSDYLTPKGFNALLQKYGKTNSLSTEQFKEEFGNALEQILLSNADNNTLEIKNIMIGLDQSVQAALANQLGLQNLDINALQKIKKYFFGYLQAKTKIDLYLYEILDANIANYSPTEPMVLHTAHDIFKRLADPDFSPKRSVILQEKLPQDLTTAKNSSMRFVPNGVRVSAQSDGLSLLLLPLQYSHCYKVTQVNAQNSNQQLPRLMRANLIESALLFEGNIDVLLKYEFNLGSSHVCMKEDLYDNQLLELEHEY